MFQLFTFKIAIKFCLCTPSWNAKLWNFGQQGLLLNSPISEPNRQGSLSGRPVGDGRSTMASIWVYFSWKKSSESGHPQLFTLVLSRLFLYTSEAARLCKLSCCQSSKFDEAWGLGPPVWGLNFPRNCMYRFDMIWMCCAFFLGIFGGICPWVETNVSTSEFFDKQVLTWLVGRFISAMNRFRG